MKEENQRLSVAMKKLKEKQGDKESNIEVKDHKYRLQLKQLTVTDQKKSISDAFAIELVQLRLF